MNHDDIFCKKASTMILDAARLALLNLFAVETRSVFLKVLAVTCLVLGLTWYGIRSLLIWLALPWIDAMMPGIPEWAGWLTLLIGIAASIGLALMLALLIAPATALIAGLFLDEVAEVIEKRDYPLDPPGKAMPLGEAMRSTIRFVGVIILGNLVALLLLLIPGVNLMAFFLVNGYLLGREFFEFAASRFRGVEEARAFRARHSGTVFLAGLLIAAFLTVPILNLLTPLFAAGLMVHLHKVLSASGQA
jgi:CysZ protein